MLKIFTIITCVLMVSVMTIAFIVENFTDFKMQRTVANFYKIFLLSTILVVIYLWSMDL